MVEKKSFKAVFSRRAHISSFFFIGLAFMVPESCYLSLG